MKGELITQMPLWALRIKSAHSIAKVAQDLQEGAIFVHLV
jgi:hypothetical protein